MTVETNNGDDFAPDLTGRIDALWRERNWSGDLLERVRASGLSPSRLIRFLELNAPMERFEEEIEWAIRFRDGSMRFRQLSRDDDEAFRELWSNSPEAIGDWDVMVERGHNPFAQFELQEKPAFNALFDANVMVACISFSIRRTVVGGQPLVIHYGQAMRVHDQYRGQKLAHWVRSLPWVVGMGRPTHLQYDYIRSGNMAMDSWNKKFMSNVESVTKRDDNVPGEPVTVLQFPARRPAEVAKGVRPARVPDLEQCVALVNRTHEGRDLFRAYTLDSLMERLDAGLIESPRVSWRRPYAMEDFHVLEEGGEVVACAGLWDRGRDVRERWRHRETGEERVVAVTSLLDYGFKRGREADMAVLLDHLIGLTDALGRDYLVAPLAYLPDVAARLLDSHEPIAETRYLQWRADTPPLSLPIYLDLVYW